MSNFQESKISILAESRKVVGLFRGKTVRHNLSNKKVGESDFEAQFDVGIGSIQGKGWPK